MQGNSDGETAVHLAAESGFTGGNHTLSDALLYDITLNDIPHVTIQPIPMLIRILPNIMSLKIIMFPVVFRTELFDRFSHALSIILTKKTRKDRTHIDII